MDKADPVDEVAEVFPRLAAELPALPPRNLTLFREACEALAKRVDREIAGSLSPDPAPKGLRFMVG